MRMIPELLRNIEAILPPEVWVPLFVLLGIAAIPAWITWLRTKQIKGQLRRMLRASDPDEKASHRNAAFALAAGRPRRLVFLADEAYRLGQKGVFLEALEALEATGKYPKDIRRLRDKVEASPKRGGHPLEEAVIIERMWEQGLHAAARERLAEVRGRFPKDEDLADLAHRLDAQEAPEDARDAP